MGKRRAKRHGTRPDRLSVNDLFVTAREKSNLHFTLDIRPFSRDYPEEIFKHYPDRV